MLSRDFPEDLVVEILSRLPVKSLMQFKCVRKSWHGLMRNHSFITQHHKWATSNNQGRGVVFVYENERLTYLSLLSNDTLEVSRDMDISPFFQDEITLFIDGPCNGIFFLYGIPLTRYYGEDIVLWNPATTESKVLPIIKQRPRYTAPTVSFIFGFGIDPKTNDLKVVRIVDFQRHKQPQFESILWLRCLFGFMISFDMSNEVFQETPLPPITEDPCSNNKIAIINESVSLIVEYYDEDFDEEDVTINFIKWYDVWVMNETGVEWT
ncbi:F-box only protein 8-like [Quercus lobata]|uniref:F-box domain-containing protein n=1 Tax=Quercus lobata TaxID=97700 RepID=A0A7N2R139_QUELO|nr:F-box only protein 8-like [Quercus lobata]